MKKVLISILTLIFIVSMITTVYAAEGSISLSASADSVVKGKTFTVTVAGTADNNITALQGSLTYDSNKLSIESKSAGNGFSDMSGTGEIAISSSSSENLSKAATLYTITFKVLDTAAEGETTISVTNAVLALVNEQATQENTSPSSDEVTITIKADDTTVNNQGGATTDGNDTQTEDKGNQTQTPSNTTSGNKSNSTSTTKKNTTKKTTKLPQTGVEIGSVIAIIALGAISIASYVSYKKYKNI